MENASSGNASGVSGAAGGPVSVPPVSDLHATSSDNGGDNQSTRSPSNQADDEPEWEFSNGKKFKRSVAEKRIQDFEKGFHKTAQAKAELSKKMSALDGALQRFGISAEEFLQNPDEHMSRAAQALIARQVDESMQDPKEREMSDREKALQAREAKIKERDEAEAKTATEQRVQAHIEKITSEMAPALKAAGLPKNPKTIVRMAEVLSSALKKGVRLDAGEAAEYVKEQLHVEQDWHLQQHFESDNIDGLMADLERVKPGAKELIRKWFIASHQKQTKGPAPVRPTTPPKDASTGKYIGWAEYSKQRRI